MAALADYLDLRFAVGDAVGNRNLSDVFPRLIQMAEAYLNKELRTRQQITSVTLTFTNGAAPLPADFLEMLHVFGTSQEQLRDSTLADSRRVGSMWDRYSVDGGSIYIDGLNGTRDIKYYAKIPTLTASPTTSNWLLADSPDVYLHATTLEAAKFIKDVELAQATKVLLDNAMNELRIADERWRWSNSTVRVAGVTP